MPLWGNTDSANNKPHFPLEREVTPVASFITANATTSGNTIVVNANPTAFAAIANGYYVYSGDANNAISRHLKDLSIIDGNEASLFKSNNTITNIDASNNIIKLANPVMREFARGEILYVGNTINYHSGTTQTTYSADTILITATRMANTQGTNGGAGSTVANTKIGNTNIGWNRIVRKINSDGTIRFLKETLVALASPTASNTQSANTSANAIFGGV